jgi:hypothetical protein
VLVVSSCLVVVVVVVVYSLVVVSDSTLWTICVLCRLRASSPPTWPQGCLRIITQTLKHIFEITLTDDSDFKFVWHDE